MKPRTRRPAGGGGARVAPRASLPAAALLAAVLAGLVAGAPPAAAQEGADLERRTAAEDTARREIAGLRVGSWQVQGLQRLPEASYSTIPAFDLFYQRGLGERTALQLSVGLWRRGRVNNAGTLGMWVSPLFAGVKAYPAGGPEGRLDPYLSAAGGPALGFELRRSSGFGSLVSGWTAAIGAGAEAGGGLEVELTRRLGLALDARYQWVEYLAGRLDGPDTYRGAVLGAAVTYRLDLR